MTLHTTQFTFPVGSVGKSFAFKVEAFNIIGSVYSTAGASYTLADLPVTPTAAPASDEAYTSETRIKVDITPLTLA